METSIRTRKRPRREAVQALDGRRAQTTAWVARDANGELHLFFFEPLANGWGWWSVEGPRKDLDPPCFPLISWLDARATKVTLTMEAAR